MDRDPSERREGRISTDRETIRGWAEEHGAVPARHSDVEGESEEYRVVSESDVGESHERVEWDDFFGQLDEGDHVVVYHGTEASEPFEVTRRNEIISRSAVDEEELENRLLEGEVVTSEITETTVVESVVVEEATVESELVDTEVVNERVVDVELLERECTGCTLIEEGGVENRDWFDEDRYLSSIGMGAGQGGVEPGRAEAEPVEAESSPLDAETGSTGADAEPTGTEAEPVETEPTPIESTDGIPYSVEFDVEEAWSVTREFLERFTVESRIAGTEVAETDTVEDRDIDVEGLHQSIAQSDLLDIDLTSDEVLSECEIQTEFAEGDRIQTQFKREHVVEEEVVDRKRLRAEVTGGDLLEMELVRTQELATEGADEPPVAAGVEGEPEAEVDAGTEAGAGIESGAATGGTTLTEDEIGKTVVDTSGEEVGMITDVDESSEIAHVDAHPGITERIKAALDWGGAADDDYPVETDQIERVTDDRVELKGTEELDEGEQNR